MTTEYLSVNTFIERYQQAAFPGISYTPSEVKEWCFELLRQIGPQDSELLIDTKIDINAGRGKLPSNIVKLKEVKELDSMYNMVELFNNQKFTNLSYKLYNSYIYTDFEKGAVILTYIGQPIDSEDNPLIPNESYYISAMDAYIRYRMSVKAWVQKKLSLNEVEMLRTTSDFYAISARAENKAIPVAKQRAFMRIRNRH